MTQHNETGVVLLSGGIDSATCLALADIQCDVVIPVHMNYGQQTELLEEKRASKLAEYFDVEPMKYVDYRSVVHHFSEGVASTRDSFTNEDGSMEEDDGRSTGYTPMRNLHFLSTAAGIADVNNGDVIYLGAHGGEDSGYPDCRQPFILSAMKAISESMPGDENIKIEAPLLKMEKNQVIEFGEELGVPWEYTYSCYSETDFENPVACGECPACEERLEAFEKAEVEDPVQYE